MFPPDQKQVIKRLLDILEAQHTRIRDLEKRNEDTEG